MPALAQYVLDAARREMLADGVDPRVIEQVLARVRVDVVASPMRGVGG